LHLASASLADIKDCAFARNVRNGLQVEEGSAVMAQRCR
jgi:hypothetical protein